MAFFDQFTLPVKGLYLGVHEYEFDIDDFFFKASETKFIESGSFKVHVKLHKNIDMMILNIQFNGYWRTICDRCTADIDLPVEGNNEILVKYGEKEVDEGDIVYIMKESSELNVAKIIHDSIIIGLPIQKIFDCDSSDPKPCDETVLNRLNSWNEEGDYISSTSIWSGLSGLQMESEE